MPRRIRTSHEKTEEKWRYPRPEYYRRQLQPITPGTIYWHPEVELKDGYSEVVGHRIFVADATGKMHEVLEWELSHVELSARCVRDPKRRAHLFDPNRRKTRGDEYDPALPTNAKDLRTYIAKLTRAMSMTPNVMEREPGEEG